MLALRDSPGTPNEHRAYTTWLWGLETHGVCLLTVALEKFWLTLAGIYMWVGY
jgi:hypothetical protein